ncbi:MAG: Verru_Chthon cassette protein B [Candidatus Methylacidiphilales bacterium]|nr:Verru_Chthon cassette protein B [Candidatus Methylacidiphilales bacterium]
MNSYRKDTRPLRRKARKAFTLVEMVISIGVVGFSFMTMVGMLSTGMQIFQRAMDLTAKPQMVQHILGEVDQVPYISLTNMQGRTFFFDDAGNVMEAANESRSIYKATLDLSAGTVLPADVPTPNAGLTTLTIKFTRTQGGTAGRPPETFVSFIPDRYHSTAP